MATRPSVEVVALLFALLAGCRAAETCRPGTILITCELPSRASVPAEVDVGVAVGGNIKTTPITLRRRIGSLEIVFPGGYPENQVVGLSVTLRGESSPILAGMTTASKG